MKSKNHIHYTLLVIIIALLSIFLFGCGYSKEDKQIMREYKEQAIKNAKNYIKEKYSIEAKAIEVVCDKFDPSPIPNIFAKPTGKVSIKFRDDEEKEFWVYITGNTVTSEGIDNYQYDTILRSVTEQVDYKLCPIVGKECENITLRYGAFDTLSEGTKPNGMVSEYFNGNNLEAILTDNKAKVIIDYIDVDLSKITPSYVDFDIILMNYRGKASYLDKPSKDYAISLLKKI